MPPASERGPRGPEAKSLEDLNAILYDENHNSAADVINALTPFAIDGRVKTESYSAYRKTDFTLGDGEVMKVFSDGYVAIGHLIVKRSNSMIPPVEPNNGVFDIVGTVSETLVTFKIKDQNHQPS